MIDKLDGTIVFEHVITEDVWWRYDWNNPDVFTATFDFTASDSYTLTWVGFEGCCGGSSTLRFSTEGGAIHSPDLGRHHASPRAQALQRVTARAGARRAQRDDTPTETSPFGLKTDLQAHASC